MVLPDGLLEDVAKSESPNSMIVALASLLPLHARLQVAIQSAELAGIVEGELSRYRYVPGCRRSAGGVSVLTRVSRVERISARTYLQRNRPRSRRSSGDSGSCSRPRDQLESPGP